MTVTLKLFASLAAHLPAEARAGHSLQLDDLYWDYQSEKTMYGYAAKGETKKRTLTWDDRAGIKFIYGVK